MAKYKLVFKKSVTKDLRPIPKKDIARILQCINQLQEDPRPSNCEKLSGLDKYRVRQGIYRVIYEVQDKLLIVTAVKVGHRKHVYERR